jgi:hypothetical protein
MKTNLTILAVIITILASCSKEPGEGGSSSISGKVFVRDYNKDYTELNGIYYGANETVYIIYGDGTVYDNSMKTSYDGSYRFNYLRKGHYRVFCYSEDSTMTMPSGIFPVIREVDITSNKQDIVLDDLVIIK